MGLIELSRNITLFPCFIRFMLISLSNRKNHDASAPREHFWCHERIKWELCAVNAGAAGWRSDTDELCLRPRAALRAPEAMFLQPAAGWGEDRVGAPQTPLSSRRQELFNDDSHPESHDSGMHPSLQMLGPWASELGDEFSNRSTMLLLCRWAINSFVRHLWSQDCVMEHNKLMRSTLRKMIRLTIYWQINPLIHLHCYHCYCRYREVLERHERLIIVFQLAQWDHWTTQWGQIQQ